MIKKFIRKLMERRKRNIEFRKEFKKKTGVDLNDVHIHGDGPPVPRPHFYILIYNSLYNLTVPWGTNLSTCWVLSKSFGY